MAKRRLAEVRADLSFKGRQFTAEVILWAVRWYLMFPISYRDLELMLADRGVTIAHTTIFRWIQAYTPELEKRIRPHLYPSNGSWRVDETYVKMKGRWTYLYRAVDGSVAKSAAGCEWDWQQANQAATSNSSAIKVAWARMSRPQILRTCPFLTIAITS